MVKQYKFLEEQSLFDMQPVNLPTEWIKHLTKSAINEHLHKRDFSKSNYPPSDAEKVAQRCNFIRHCIADSQTLSEPDWKFGLIGVIAFCDNGIDWVHKWSEDYSNYTVEETNKKINYALKFSHPTTCEGLQNQCSTEFCTDCEYNGRIKSPIVLGYENSVYEEVEEQDNQEDKPNLNFPIEVFPANIQKLILNASYVMDAPPEYYAASIIAVTAFLINSQGFVKVKKTGWAEPAVLWIALVGEPGKKKTPVYKYIKAILDKIDKELEDMYFQKKNVADETGIEPTRILIYTSDTTVEGIAYYQDKNPHGIGIMRDELAGFIQGFDKYQKGNDRTYFLSSFSGDDYIVCRKKDAPYKVMPYHNIFGVIQPSKVENLLLNDLRVTDGFTERFLFCLTNYTKRAKANHSRGI